MNAVEQAVVGLVVLSACAVEPEPPVHLRFAAEAVPTVYRTSYAQTIQWGPATTVTRTYGARHTVIGTSANGGAAVRLDSLRANVATPHGQQSIDTRHIVGTEFSFLANEAGGSPAYEGEPILEAPGIIEQRVALSRLLDYGFPHLPAGLVQVGDTWSARSARSQVEVQLTMPADLTTAYRFTGWDTVDGSRVVRIEGQVTGSMSARAEQERGPALGYTGTLSGRITWLFDPAAGAILSVTGEEISEGVLTAGDAETPIRQTTTIDIRGTTSQEGV